MFKNKKTTRRLFFLISFFLVYLFYLTWRAFFTLPLHYGIISATLGVILLIAEIVGFFESMMFYITLWDTSTPSTPEVSTKDFPDVDIFIATYNEPIELLRKTIIGCKNMKYPDKSKVHIYICDDGNRAQLAEFCSKMKVNYITRTEHTHAKAGNLNHALSVTSSPYVVTFDADMIPMNDFLMKTVPFFLTGESIGFVQVPQSFYNPDPFQYNLFAENNMPNEQDLFSHLIQAGKCRANAIIYAGSNTVISRKALDDIGGLAVGTITEDFATGMKIQSKGYKCIYLNELHASGLSPENLEDLYNQRIRWGRGVIQTFKMFNPLRQKGLNLLQKIMYFSSFSYWYFGLWRFIFLSSPIYYSLFGIVVLSAPAWSIVLIWLPMFSFTNIVFRFFAKGVRNVTWSHIYDTILFPEVITGVLAETFGFKLKKFKVTPKDSVTRKHFINKYRFVWVQILLAILSVAGIVRLTILSFMNHLTPAYIINFFWLIYNLSLLGLAIFFSSERPKRRDAERVSLEANVRINHDNYLQGSVLNISESGVAVVMERPVFLEPHNTNHTLEITSDRYLVTLTAQIARVDNLGEKHLYCFKFNDIDEINYEQLILMLYDRVPCLPKRLTKDQLYTNIGKNIVNRSQRISYAHNDLPRVLVNKPFLARSEDKEFYVFMYDFNFKFGEFSLAEKYPAFQIPLGQDGQLILECKHAMTLSAKKKFHIYQITNCRELAQSHDLIDLLLADRNNWELDDPKYGNLPLTKIKSNIKFQLRQSKERGEQL